MNVSKEDELEGSTSASKRRRKHSKSDEGKPNEKPVKEKKCKRNKKVLEGKSKLFINSLAMHA